MRGIGGDGYTGSPVSVDPVERDFHAHVRRYRGCRRAEPVCAPTIAVTPWRG
jgi:hypothetical protein